MSSQSDGVVDDATKTAPEQGEEQTSSSLQNQLLELAKDKGLLDSEGPVAEDPPTVVETPEVEDQPMDEPEEEKPEEEPEQVAAEEEQEAEDKPKVVWPDSAKARVAEETEKRKRANERADRAEGEISKRDTRIAELESQLATSSGPLPTPDNPLVDIQEPRELDRLERVYEKLEEVDLEQRNEDDTVTVPVDLGRDGKFIYKKVSPEDARLAQKRADRVLRKDIPRRREYLTQRAQIDAQAEAAYPDLKDPGHDFTKLVNQITNQVLSGQVLNSPEVKFWVANAVYGAIKRGEELKSAQNGQKNGDAVKQIAEASKQKIAPSTPRTRQVVERRSGADLKVADQQLRENPDDRDTQLAWLAAARSESRSQRKALQPTPE